jgi:hypothetical protein
MFVFEHTFLANIEALSRNGGRFFVVNNKGISIMNLKGAFAETFK